MDRQDGGDHNGYRNHLQDNYDRERMGYHDRYKSRGYGGYDNRCHYCPHGYGRYDYQGRYGYQYHDPRGRDYDDHGHQGYQGQSHHKHGHPYYHYDRQKGSYMYPHDSYHAYHSHYGAWGPDAPDMPVMKRYD